MTRVLFRCCVTLFLFSALCSSLPSWSATDDIPAPARELRGVWIATLANIDWPKSPGLSSDEQKQQLESMLDQMQKLNMNTVIFQVRPACDAMYKSSIEPWCKSLTGRQGEGPTDYDPLAFAIEQCHKRGLLLHAWFNPFRAASNKDGQFASNHVSKTHPEFVRGYGKSLWLDPGSTEARAYSLRVIEDVTRRYDVDGIHFDDYFYPYQETGADGKIIDFPDDATYKAYQDSGGKLSRDDWRRDNVNQFIQAVSEGIKKIKPTVQFGISPFGIWRPNNPTGVSGLDSYATLYADSRKWLSEGWVDYLAPQLYWPTTGRFTPLLNWWDEQNPHHRILAAGIFTGKVGSSPEWSPSEIEKEITTTRNTRGVSGTIHFSAKCLENNQDGIADLLAKDTYSQPALPPIAEWLDGSPPAKPEASLDQSTSGSTVVRWKPPTTNVFEHAVYAEIDGVWHMALVPGASLGYSLGGSPSRVAVSAIDRIGNESERSILPVPSDEK